MKNKGGNKMAKRGNSKKKTTNTQNVSNKTKVDLENIPGLAHQVLTGDGKNPYYFGGVSIQNLSELQTHLKNFQPHEANWLAEWIAYLGDEQTANKIQKDPENFRNIISTRYNELKKHVED